MDVLKFSGVSQVSWILAIKEYFSLLNTPTDQWLKILGFNLEGTAADWFQWMTKNGLITTWARFEEREFLVSRPTTLGDAFSLSLITKARLDDQAAPVVGTTTKTFGNNGGDESESSGPVTPTENEETIESEDTSILNSLFRYGSLRSLQLFGTLGTGKVHILIDNGSTHNFVQPGVVERMKLPVKNMKLFKVYIGNVKTLFCKNIRAQVTLEIVGRIYLFLERLNAKYIKKKKMKAGFQRRIWKPDIKIVFKTPP
ncbi:hypothetical protein Tco_0591495 [Tanacetum coccineum]